MKKEKRIACIYNMNNNMFTLARFLKDRGYKTDVLLMNEDDHFLPSCDTFKDDHGVKIVETNWISKTDWMGKVKKEDVKDLTKQYDLLIGCGYTPAFMEWIGKKLDIFIPYGSDFYLAPFEKVKVFNPDNFEEIYPQLQFKGIENSRHLIFDYTSEQEPVFSKFDLKGKRHYFFPPVFYSKEYNRSSISEFYSKSSIYPLMKSLRNENDFLIIQHCRQSWKNPQDEFSNKRNDILIHAFYKLIQAHPNLKTKLILFEYGVDVEASRQLISELGISHLVVWMQKLPRKEVMVVLSMVDFGVAELGLSFFMYGTVGEFMTMQVPFILNCKKEDFKNAYPELYEVRHADSVESCLLHLESYLKNSVPYKADADKNREWFMKYIIQKPTDMLVDIVEEELDKSWFKKILS